MLSIQKKLNQLTSKTSKRRYSLAKEIESRQNLSRDELNNFQLSKLNLILTHASHTVPYYRQLFSDLGLIKNSVVIFSDFSEIESIPILSKEIIKQQKEEMFSSEYIARRAYENSSGGSTGEPVHVLQDGNYLENAQANFILVKSWRGIDAFDSTIALWGAERDTYKDKKPALDYIKDFFRNRMVLNCFRMSSVDMARYINVLNSNRPSLIVAYANAIYELALYAEENKIPVVPQHAIHTGAGMLHDYMRVKIKDVFNCEVYDHYGSREVGSIASECRMHQGLHILCEHTFVEVVDEAGVACAPGVEGEILVTTLNNFSMPLIRYRIGDLGIMSADLSCDCGVSYPKLSKITGRISGIFRNSNGDRISGQFFTHIFRYYDWIKHYQVIQKKIDFLIVYIVSNKERNVDQKDLKELEGRINLAMKQSCNVKFKFVDKIPETSTGKHLNTISELG